MSINSSQKEQTLDGSAIVDRLLLVYKAKSDSDYASKRGLARSTVGNWRVRPSVPYSECEHAFLQLNVSMDWLLTGVGNMYRSSAPISQIVTMGKGHAVVSQNTVNNGNIVTAVGAGSVSEGGKGQRLCDFIHWFERNCGMDDMVWLEQHILRTVPEFAAYLKAKA